MPAPARANRKTCAPPLRWPARIGKCARNRRPAAPAHDDGQAERAHCGEPARHMGRQLARGTQPAPTWPGRRAQRERARGVCVVARPRRRRPAAFWLVVVVCVRQKGSPVVRAGSANSLHSRPGATGRTNMIAIIISFCVLHTLARQPSTRLRPVVFVNQQTANLFASRSRRRRRLSACQLGPVRRGRPPPVGRAAIFSPVTTTAAGPLVVVVRCSRCTAARLAHKSADILHKSASQGRGAAVVSARARAPAAHQRNWRVLCCLTRPTWGALLGAGGALGRAGGAEQLGAAGALLYGRARRFCAHGCLWLAN